MAITGARSSSPLIAVVYTATILLSAVLIFWIEPLFPKMILPIVGGTPATWITALMFYQSALLLGYAYSFLLTRLFPLELQIALHTIVLALAAVALPPALPASAHLSDHPAFQVLFILAAGIGAPLLALSATAPLLQHWFTRTRPPHAHAPYFLYAASNVGSLGALLAFPLVVEPTLGLHIQTRAWSIGYGLLALLILASAALARGTDSPSATTASASRTAATGHPWRERALWLALAAVPSSLLSGTTTKITTEAAAGPLFWVVPLALYLLTFALAFARHRRLPLRPMLIAQTIATALIVVEALIEGEFGGWPIIAILIALLFLSAYVCNCRLADSRPGPDRTGEFYLVIALGGLLGGTFNALIAPNIFPDVIEFPLALVLAMALRPSTTPPHARDILTPLSIGVLGAVAMALSFFTAMPQVAPVLSLVFAILLFPLSRVPLRLGAGLAAAFLVAAIPSLIFPPLDRERNFFGVIKVLEDRENALHLLVNGSILHGLESTDADTRDEPTSYYHRRGPLGDVMTLVGDKLTDGAAVIGLGAGTVACYGSGAAPWTFFEINPAVIRVAGDARDFSFLRDCQPDARLRLGDGRLLLASDAGRYPLIVLDAFSSDAVPIHLLTLEALSAYLEKLTPDGVIAVNISNRFIDLLPILAAAGARLGLTAASRFDTTTDRLARSSKWVALARSPERLAPLIVEHGWSRASSGSVDAWTDDRSDLFLPLLWHMRTGP
jgi:hypothetical protein